METDSTRDNRALPFWTAPPHRRRAKSWAASSPVKPKLTAETPSPANLPMGGSGPGFLGKG